MSHQKIILFSIIFTLAFFAAARNAEALDMTAASCTVTEIESKAAAIIAAGGGTLTLPACDETITLTIDISPTAGQTFNIIGQGAASTILRRSGTPILKIAGPQGGNGITFVRVSGIGFYGQQVTGTTGAIYVSNTNSFRIDNCRFYDSRWASPIELKATNKGVIDHNVIEGRVTRSSDYGISMGSNYQSPPTACINDSVNHTSCSDNTCTSYYTAEKGESGCGPGTWCEDCRDTWWAWYKNKSTNNGMDFPSPDSTWDWMPGTDKAVFVEDNTFHYAGPAVEGNWGSRMALVFRHNTVYEYDELSSTLTSFKPGAHFFEVYANDFYMGKAGVTARPGTLRSDGVIYNNNYHDLALSSGYINTYFCSNGFCYPEYVSLHELYIWGNTASSAACGNINTTDCWREQEGDLERITPDIDYFFRSPTTGDRIYSGNLAQPVVQYTYPHPLAVGTTDTTPPVAPTGVTVQ